MPRVNWRMFGVLVLCGLVVAGLRTEAQQAKGTAVPEGGGKALGSKSAPITMEVFSDFQCPACRTLFLETVRPVIANYVSMNKVYFVHRDMPLPSHAYSREAARYANAAARLGKLEKVAEALYTQQPSWSVHGNVDAVVAAALTPAEMARVRQMVRTGQVDAGIDQDVALSRTHRVSQTPTMIITAKGQTFPIVGVVSYSVLRQFLEEQLRR